MYDFTMYLPTKLIFGKNTIEKLPEIMAPYRRILLTYGGGSIKKNGIYDQIRKLLADKELVDLAGIEPNPKVQSARIGVKLIREHKCDAILAVGGGSVIDLSKLIARAVSYDGDPWDLVLDPALAAKQTSLPLADVLTIAATGSEYDAGGVISNPDTNEKLPVWGEMPFASILDPVYTFSVSAYQTASGAADIMSHTLESYLVKEGCTLTDGLCEAMLRTVIKNTPLCLKDPDNYSARAEIMQAASFGCCGILHNGMSKAVWACHAIEHELSAYTDITHGAALAVITPPWMRKCLNEDNAARFAKYGRNVWGITGEDDMAVAEDAILKTAQFFRNIGLPASLTEMGVDKDLPSHFEDMACHIEKHWFASLKDGICPLKHEDVIEILNCSM